MFVLTVHMTHQAVLIIIIIISSSSSISSIMFIIGPIPPFISISCWLLLQPAHLEAPCRSTRNLSEMRGVLEF